jgi:type I restriction enzyme, R subunit
MLVCIDKITCARIYQRIMPLWQAKAAQVPATFEAKQTEALATNVAAG